MKIAIATSTRADWGLLTPLAHSLDEKAELHILATNMHLMPQYGHAIDQIRAEGFSRIREVPMQVADPSSSARVEGMAQCMRGTAKALEEIKPDILVILGDRYEMLAVASAASVMHVPIAHIAGGEISEGAIDDNLRHAITKLSTLHFTETEEYRRRVIQMGEQPERVFNAGSLGVWNILHQPLVDAEELQRDLGFEFRDKKLILATLHPATLAHPQENDACENMLLALEAFEDYRIVITYPNNDEGSEAIIEQLKAWAPKHPNTLLVKSLGMKRYLSLLRHACAVVGNSSSGIIEVPSIGIPTVNIGSRQQGRLAAQSVINCDTSLQGISQAIRCAIGDEMQQRAALRQNPYCKPDTVDIIAEQLLRCDPQKLLRKKFFNIDIDGAL